MTPRARPSPQHELAEAHDRALSGERARVRSLQQAAARARWVRLGFEEAAFRRRHADVVAALRDRRGQRAAARDALRSPGLRLIYA